MSNLTDTPTTARTLAFLAAFNGFVAGLCCCRALATPAPLWQVLLGGLGFANVVLIGFNVMRIKSFAWPPVTDTMKW